MIAQQPANLQAVAGYYYYNIYEYLHFHPASTSLTLTLMLLISNIYDHACDHDNNPSLLILKLRIAMKHNPATSKLVKKINHRS